MPVVKPAAAAAPIVEAEAEIGGSAGRGFSSIVSLDGAYPLAFAFVLALSGFDPKILPSPNLSIERPLRCRLDPDPDLEPDLDPDDPVPDCAETLSSREAVPGGLAGDTANIGVCGSTPSRSRIVELEVRPAAGGGVLTWYDDAGEGWTTSTVGRCGVLFFSLLLSLSLATGEAPVPATVTEGEAEVAEPVEVGTRGEDGFCSRLGVGFAVPSAGGDGSDARDSPGYST